VLFVLVALAIAFTVAAGLGPLAFIPVALAVVVAIWFFVGLVTGHSPGREVRRTRRAKLLGPGGPDDPDA